MSLSDIFGASNREWNYIKPQKYLQSFARIATHLSLILSFLTQHTL